MDDEDKGCETNEGSEKCVKQVLVEVLEILGALEPADQARVLRSAGAFFFGPSPVPQDSPNGASGIRR